MQMKAAVLAASVVISANAEGNAALNKVLAMIDGLIAEVLADGEATHKLYVKFAKFCEDGNQELAPEIKTATSQKAEFEAIILEASSDIDAATSEIDELASSIAQDEKDLKEATHIRGKEHTNFVAVEKDTAETIDMLERAIVVIERGGGGTDGNTFLQANAEQGITQALQALVSAEQLSQADSEKLAALVQTENDSKNDDAAFGAPAAAVSADHIAPSGIQETLQGLLDTAQEQLDNARADELSSKQVYDMKKQTLEAEIKNENKDLVEAKKSSAASAEKKAVAKGDLGMVVKSLNIDKADSASLLHDCMTHAETYETEVASRSEELKALGIAKKIVIDVTDGLNSASFLQTKSASSEKSNKMVRMVKDLANEEHSMDLSQLASRMSSAIRIGSAVGQPDIFQHIREMTQEMIDKLEKEAGDDATRKEFCDKEMAETKAKKEDKDAEVEKLSTRLEQKQAESIRVAAEVPVLQKELAELAGSQATMDQLRLDESAVYEKLKPELTTTIKGIQMALKFLKDFYNKGSEEEQSVIKDTFFGSGHSKGGGGVSDGIIALLETAEADFSKNLMEINAEEEVAARAYKDQTAQNELTKLEKDAGVKYKTKETASLEQAVSETQTDLSGVQDELTAVNSAFDSLKGQCVDKAETYEQRKEKRETEIARLQDSLARLESDNAELGASEEAAAEGAVAEGAPAEGVPAEGVAAAPEGAAPVGAATEVAAAEGPAAEGGAEAAAPVAAEGAAPEAAAAEVAAAEGPAAEGGAEVAATEAAAPEAAATEVAATEGEAAVPEVAAAEGEVAAAEGEVAAPMAATEVAAAEPAFVQLNAKHLRVVKNHA